MFAPLCRANSLVWLLLLCASLVAPSLCLSAPGPQQSTVVLSVPELKARADSGDSSARFQLAQFLVTANPSAPDFELAVTWLRSVAENNRYYEFILGYLYEQGRGLLQDYSTAARYYEAAGRLSPSRRNLRR